MLAIAVVILAVLTVLAVRVGGTVLFPPALFCVTWCATLGGVLVAGPGFLPISEYTCLIYVVGAIAFVLGGVAVLHYFEGPGQVGGLRVCSPDSTRRVLDLMLIFLIAAYPYYLHIALRIAGTSNPVLYFATMRGQMLQARGNPFGPAGNLNVLAALVAGAMVYESDGTGGRRLRAAVAVILALAYGVLTGSKGGVLMLVTLFFITQIRAGHLKPAAAITAFAMALTLFVAGLWAINFSGRSFGDVSALARRVGGEISNYWLGSSVAFSQVVTKPDSLPSTESIGRFFLQTERSMGVHVRIPGIVAPFTVFSANGENSNTYTIYFSYFKEYGWLGSIVLLSALGGLLTLIWRRAMGGGAIAILFYASFCTAIVQSIESENFFLGLNGYIKALIVYGLLYWAFPRYFPGQKREIREKARSSGKDMRAQ